MSHVVWGKSTCTSDSADIKTSAIHAVTTSRGHPSFMQTVHCHKTGTRPRQIGPQFPPPYVEPPEEDDPTPSSHLLDDYWGPFINDVPNYSERHYNPYADCEG